MRLWTFQAIKSVNELEKNGELIVNWGRYPKNDSWKKAYEWMRDQMEEKGINCNGYAPIWSWHSCKKYGQAPTLDDARNLLCDLELGAGIKTIEMECPNNLVLLSSYAHWNDILDRFIMGKNEIKINQKILKKIFNIPVRKLNKYDAIQGTLPCIKMEWVIDIRELKLKVNEDDYDANELV